ncbi:hypothetical protein [Desulfurella sp.]|uniref:hypothetical protein n=1 Tax=Desulfurella sp. TaxID=1962857 RepID=UPI0025B90E14|nr:hypothetical protein [Desulfurella sp.]
MKKEIQEELKKEQEISAMSLAILILDLYKRLDELEYEIENIKDEQNRNKVNSKTNNKEVIELLKYFK